MTEEKGALMPHHGEGTPKSSGGFLSFLAFVFSIVSLVGTGWIYWERMQPSPVISPLVRAADVGVSLEALAKLEEAFESQKKEAASRAEELAALRQEFIALSKTVQEVPKSQALSTEGLEAVTGVFQQRLVDIESKTIGSVNKIAQQQETLAKTTAISLRLDEVTRRLRDGLKLDGALKPLAEKLAGSEEAVQHLQNLRAYAEKTAVSDAVLLEGLRALTPDFIAREKMDAASGTLEKVAAQLQKLVVIRPRHGQQGGEGVAGKIAQLSASISEGDFALALKLADELASKPPKDFPAWQASLKQRADAEDAVAKIRAVSFGSIKPQNNEGGEAAP